MRELDEEIAIWEKNLEHAKDGRPSLMKVDGPLSGESPLCSRFLDKVKGYGSVSRCFGCPVFSYTGLEHCRKLPCTAVWAAKITAERALPWICGTAGSEHDEKVAVGRVCRLLVEQTELVLWYLKDIRKRMGEDGG